MIGEDINAGKKQLSIVVPIYNTERYLQKTFSCILGQTIGLKKIEVILVNDGSTDGSSKICQDFQKQYSENVFYIESKINYGVSHARNMGLDLASGKYITFWDSDDLWSLNAMERAVDFLEMHGEEIDVVSANIEFFDGCLETHILNFPIADDQVVDILCDHKKIRSTGVVSVMKTEIARQYRFDEEQSCWEDTKYINQLLLRKRKYGMLMGVTYHYRRRCAGDSASQSYTRNKRYYVHDLEALFEGLYQESMKQCGDFIPMMQYLMAYALGYRFSEPITILNEEERMQYEQIQKDILSHIEDRYIQEIPNADTLTKWKMLAAKYDIKIKEEIDQWRRKEQEAQWMETRFARLQMNQAVLKRWFVLKQQGKEITPFFERNGYRRIAVYGMSDLGRYLVGDLAGSSVQVVYGIDRRADQLKVGLPVCTVEDALSEVDAVVVTAVYFYPEIEGVLKKKMTCPIISLEEILESIC